MKLNKTCKTCEFNFGGVCSGEGNYKYGETIKELDMECESWDISFDYFCKITEEAPWYIKNQYKRGKIYFSEFLEKLEEDETVRGTVINIYDAIEHVYGIPWWELNEILEVSSGVVRRAVCQGTVDKRKKQFAPILCIPESFFDEFYSKQLKELEECKKQFFLIHGEKWVKQKRKIARDSRKYY